MTSRTMAAALGVASLMVACAHQGGSAGHDVPAAAPDTVTGVVRQVGSVPFLLTVVQGEDTAAVAGDLEEEISRLAGARVRVFGTRADTSYPGPTIRAVDYAIISIDGEEPSVGILRHEGGTTYLERSGGEAGRLELSSVPDGLRRQVGAKVWVITSEQGGAVLRYGILRPETDDEQEDSTDLPRR